VGDSRHSDISAGVERYRSHDSQHRGRPGSAPSARGMRKKVAEHSPASVINRFGPHSSLGNLKSQTIMPRYDFGSSPRRRRRQTWETRRRTVKSLSSTKTISQSHVRPTYKFIDITEAQSFTIKLSGNQTWVSSTYEQGGEGTICEMYWYSWKGKNEQRRPTL